MSSNRRCGQLPTANGYEAFCPVCTALTAIDNQAPDAEEQWDAILDKADDISRIHAAYRRKRR